MRSWLGSIGRTLRFIGGVDAGLPQGFAHSHRIDLRAGTAKQLSCDLDKRRAGLLLPDHPQYGRVLGVQRRLAARPSCLLLRAARRHSPSRQMLP